MYLSIPQGWFDALRIELVNDNIDITMACPGPVFSNIRKSAFTENVDEVLHLQTFPKRPQVSNYDIFLITLIVPDF